jgi:hypothetical protein
VEAASNDAIVGSGAAVALVVPALRRRAPVMRAAAEVSKNRM